MSAPLNDPNAIPQLPNPFTPMAFLPPALAREVTVALYVLVGTLVVMIWDILSNVNADFQLVTRYPIRLPTIAYFISRTFTLLYLLSTTIADTAPVGHCETIGKVIPWFYPLAIPATSLLFFFRVRAMYDGNRYITGAFFVLWLAVLAVSLLSTQGVSGINIGPTDYCTSGKLAPFVAAAGIVPFINDTLSFIAISYRLTMSSFEERTIRNDVRAAIFGSYLPRFSRSLLKDGQFYYLSTVSVNLMTVIIFYIPSVPVVYRSILPVPNIALMNIMACRVYRNTRFGIFKESTTFSGTGPHVITRQNKSDVLSRPIVFDQGVESCSTNINPESTDEKSAAARLGSKSPNHDGGHIV